MVHFHCTSFTQRHDGSRMPFLIRNQTDTGGGVALQVQWQVGEPVTMAKLVNLDTMLVVPGKIIETATSPLACRTQFTQTVRDAHAAPGGVLRRSRAGPQAFGVPDGLQSD